MAIWLKLRRCSAVTIVIAVFILSGCGGKAQQWIGRLRAPKSGQISQEELWAELDKVEELAMQLLHETHESLKAEAPDERMLRTGLVRNVRVTQAINTMLRQEDPIVAFLDLWGLSVRLVKFYETGEGSTIWGERQDEAIAYAKRYEAELERVGRLFLKEEEFLEAQKEIQRFAGQNPIRQTFSNLLVFVTETRPGQPSPFGNIVAIPMAPIAAMQGVDRTAAAIHGVRGSMDRFTDVVDTLPEAAKWQLMLLLMDAEDINIVKTLMAAVTTLSESSGELVKTTRQLPETFREQVSALVEDIDKRQENLQTTLGKTEQTATAIEKSLVTATATIEAARQTALTLNETASEWESAAAATGELIHMADEWRSRAPKRDPNSPTTAENYRATAEGAAEAADEFQVLLAEARDLLESGVLAAHLQDVDSRAGELVDRIFWRLIQLVVTIAVVVVVCRLVLLRLSAKRPP